MSKRVPVWCVWSIVSLPLVTACGQPSGAVTEDLIVEVTIDQMHAWMKAGQLSSRGLTEIYLSRIERYDRRGPRINSILELNPRALAIADSLDRVWREQGPRSILHGIPVVVKDAMATADLMRTSNGSYWLMDAQPIADATVVQRLRDAGALILAKSNMDEMACCNGMMSGRGGAVRNPYDLDRFASGSSGGSAASVAANLAAVSLGGDTRSSVRFPASATSLVGLKPTLGLISRAGVVPGDVHLDVVGPMARTVTDVAILTGLLAGVDERDPFTTAAADSVLSDYRPSLRSDALRGARIGVARDGFFGLNTAIDSVMEVALTLLEREGATVVDSIVLPSVPFGGGREEDIYILDAANSRALDDYLRSLSPDSPIRSVRQLWAAALMRAHPSGLDPAQLRVYARATVELDSLPDYSLLDPDVRAAFERFMHEQREVVEKELELHDLDAIVFPTASTVTRLIIPSPSGPETVSRSRGRPEIANNAGLPELTVPAGYTSEGFPVGMSILGRPFAEAQLFGLGFAFEQATRHRRPPDLSKIPSPIDSLIPEVPVNDAFADRVALVGLSGSVEGNLLVATVEVGEPRTRTRLVDRTVWFAYPAAISGRLVLDDAGSAPSRYDLVVYRDGSSLEGLTTPVRGVRDLGLNAVRVSLGAQAGVTYAIVLGTDAVGVAGGSFTLNWRLEPVH